MPALLLAGNLTWGLLQTLAGAVVFLLNSHAPHRYVRGTVYTFWKIPGGVSLGIFIFTDSLPPQTASRLGEQPEELLLKDRMIRHEYGHSVQSLLLGPLYLPVIGVPSLIWERSRRLRRYRERTGCDYYRFFTERWADRLGALCGK